MLAIILLSYLELAAVSSISFDIVTTELALANGAHEANPLMKNRAIRIASGAGQAAFVIYASRFLRPRHPNWAKIILWVPIVTHTTAGTWNLHVAYRW